MSGTISIQAVRKAAETTQGGRARRMPDLYADWLDWLFVSRRLEPKAACRATGKFITWQCCPDHRVLVLAHRALQSRALILKPNPSQGDPFSQTWWEDQGINHNPDAQIVE